MGPSHKTGDNLLACEKKSMWVSPIYLDKILKSCRSPWREQNTQENSIQPKGKIKRL